MRLLQTHIFAGMISKSSLVPLAFGSSATTMLLTSFVVPYSTEFEIKLELAITAHQLNGKNICVDGKVGTLTLKIDNGSTTLLEEKIARGITPERKLLTEVKPVLELTEGDTIYLRLTNNTPMVIDAQCKLNVRRTGYVTMQSGNQLFTDKL